MPFRELFYGPSAAGRRERARAFLIERAPRPFRLIAASPEAGAHFARELAATEGSYFGAQRTTLDQLAYRLALAEISRLGLTPSSHLGLEAVTARVVYEAREAGELGELETVADGPGLVRALTRTLQECRLHGVTAAGLEAIGPGGAVLAGLARRFDAMLEEHGGADRAAVLERAADALTRDPGAYGEPLVLLDLPVGSRAESRLLTALVGASEEAVATVPAGDERSLVALRDVLGCSERAVEGSGSPALLDLQSHLFSDRAPEARDSPPEVTILSAPGEAQEAVEIARVVHDAAARGVAFDQIAILLRSPEVYTPLLEDAFARAGIPAHFERGTQRPDPSGRAFLALMDCAAEELSAARFAEYLSLAQLPTLDPEGAPLAHPEADPDHGVVWVPPQHALAPSADEPEQLDLFASVPEVRVEEPEQETAIAGTLRAPWRWEKLIVDAAVIGSRDRWARRLTGLSRELELRALELEDEHGARAAALAREREELEHLKRFSLPLIEELSELPTRASWGEWLSALEKLASRALARPENVLAVLKELSPMASVGPVEWGEVRDVLSERLTLLPQRSTDGRYGSVWVAPIDQARGVSVELVVVPGVAERMFPRKIAEDPLLLDEARKALDRGLPVQADRIRDERLALRLAVGAATRHITFSYPSVDLSKGRGKVPSFYLLEIARASRGELPDFEALERDAAASSGARLGWPAPRRLDEAIDESEFDLAFLADALKPGTSKEEARGTGRYLVDANASLARSLRAKYQRGLRRYTPVDGYLDPSAEGKKLLAGNRLEERAYSVTALESYAGCPYRFFLNAILRLRPRDEVEPPTHLDALTRGRILHDAQFHVLGRLEERSLLPVRPDNLEEVMREFELVFDDVSERFHEELAPAIERIWRDELHRIRLDLRGWLRREASGSGEWVALRREYTFGMPPRGPADPNSTLEVAQLEHGLRLRGAIDLVERRADGRVRVTDHKSGKAWMPAEAILNGGKSLQPVLYTLAYEALTGEQVDSARLYYCTERGGYAERVVTVGEDALTQISEFQRRIDDVIETGVFPASPEPRFGCTYCDYLPVCGPRMEADAVRKQADPLLSPLNWLRSLT